MHRRISRLLVIAAAPGLALALITTTAGAASASPAASAARPGGLALRAPHQIDSAIICQPNLSGSAFPYTATTQHPPLPCGNSFAWGFTVSGSGTGQAEWDSPFYGSWTCRADAWIPDSHSNDPNAQYYIWDGSRYLANDAFVNQGNVTNNYTNVTNGTWFHISDHMRITLNDHNPKGQAGWYIAAYALQFYCY